MPRAKQRTAALRDRVLQVAVAMLASDGVAGFTTRRVAERAATSTPAVYELFGDKAGLVRERVLQVAVAMLASDGVAGFTTRRVAERAATSTPAVYELFGDKAGLVR